MNREFVGYNKRCRICKLMKPKAEFKCKFPICESCRKKSRKPLLTRS